MKCASVAGWLCYLAAVWGALPAVMAQESSVTLSARLQAVQEMLADGPPLHMAAKTGDVSRVRELLSERPRSVNALGNYDNTPLHYAAFGGHREIVELLLAKGALVNAINRAGQTPLFLAVLGRNRDAAKVLLARGASTSVRDRTGQSPLGLVVELNDEEMRAVFQPHLRVYSPPPNP
ncbi:MAG: ankyrin repeat domain-containing protein [Verrucomicrobiae bacterium]|nr:ankyrin repeat domain-containing protein [Verrucomicrobiae bacterium]